MRHLPLWLGLVACLAATSAVAKTWPNKKPSAAERGRELYETHCASCHGPKGAGDGPAAAALVAKVPDFSSGLGDRKRDDLVRSVLRGLGAMPGYEAVFEKEDGEAVVQHLANVGTMADTTLAPREEAPPAEDDEEADGDAQ